MIDVVAETGSTSADLAARLSGGAFVPEGDWLVADRQRAGRGRSGRVWSDGAGNFMGSTVVHLRSGDPPAPTLALVAGLALHAAVGPCAGGGDLRLKWPNDLLLGDAKLAGILLERRQDAVIVGIGVNLVAAPDIPGRSTVSLTSLSEAPSRDAFADRLAAALATEVARWRDYGLAPVIARWCAAGHPLGTALAVDGADGTFAGLDQDGALRLRLADGTVRTVQSGEVRLAAMAGG